jgi:hypothetical protein
MTNHFNEDDLLPNQYIPVGKTEPVTYPPLHPPKPPYDPSTSAYWPYYTEDERQVILNHPIQDVHLEIGLMRLEIDEVLKAQQKNPVTSLEASRDTLHAISVAASTIGTLSKLQRDYKSTHNEWKEFYEESMHLARIRTGVYRQVAALGYSVPDGVLEIEPDLMPKPISYAESLIIKAREDAEIKAEAALREAAIAAAAEARAAAARPSTQPPIIQ